MHNNTTEYLNGMKLILKLPLVTLNPLYICWISHNLLEDPWVSYFSVSLRAAILLFGLWPIRKSSHGLWLQSDLNLGK